MGGEGGACARSPCSPALTATSPSGGCSWSAATIRLSTGDDAPTINIRADGEGPPIVIETLYTRPNGGAVTRRSVVVRRGDKTLAVVMPRSRETNVNEILDERDFR